MLEELPELFTGLLFEGPQFSSCWAPEFAHRTDELATRRTTSLFLACPNSHHVIRAIHDCTVTPQHRRVVPQLKRIWPVHVLAVRS